MKLPKQKRAMFKTLSTIGLLLLLGLTPFGQANAYASNGHLSLHVNHFGGSASVSWVAADKSTPVKVYRNGSLLFSGVGSGEFGDSLPATENATYVVDASHTLAKSEIGILQDAADRKIAELHPSAFQLVDTVGVEIAGGASMGDSADASVNASATLFRYQTFIPMATVSAPYAGCFLNLTTPISAWDYFWGDNRGYDPNGSTYRTRFDVKVDWNLGTSVGTPYVGITHLEMANINNQGVPDGTYTLYTKRASDSTMTVVDTGTSSTLAHFSLDQNVADPYCASNGIKVHVNVNIAKSGGFSMYGSRIQVPSHEVYIRDSDATSWTTLMRADALNYLSCLTPGFACTTGVSITGSRP